MFETTEKMRLFLYLRTELCENPNYKIYTYDKESSFGYFGWLGPR